ncbi:hypothetical protein CCOS191_5271 [Pseudomonas sp. CCOS 191]|nr:hypothetical protein CCOS191_5271 [Pseudomonas sp. CCOS 191]
MLQAPRISVILTSFNHAKYLREAIDSVLEQTFTNFELIIWDDASTDESWDIISSYSDTRLKAFRNETSMRGVYGINKAISEVAQGEYIAIHHSDDLWENQKLEKQIAFLDQHDEFGAVFSNALAINESGEPYTDTQHYYYSVFNEANRTRHEWLRLFFNKGNALCHPSVLIRKQCYDTCGLYRSGLAQLADFDMWIRVCLRYQIHVLPEKLVRFRVRDNEANASGSRPETHARVFFEFSLLLEHYLSLTQKEDLLKVFPEAQVFCAQGSMRYALARVMLQTKSFDFVVPFALTILFDTLNDPSQRVPLDFDVKKFVKMTSELDPLQVIRLEQLKQSVVERDTLLSTLGEEISMRDDLLSKLGAEIASRDALLATCGTEMELGNTRVSELRGQVESLESHRSELTSQLALREKQVGELGAKVAKYEEQIADLGVQALAYEEQIADLGVKALAYEEQIADLGVQALAYEEQIADLGVQALAYEEQIADLGVQALAYEERIADLGVQALAYEERIADLGVQALAHDELIADLATKILQREEKISQLTATIMQREEQIAALDTQIIQQDSKNSSLSADIVRHSAQVADLDAQIRQREAHISELRALVAELDEQAHAREARISAHKAELVMILGSKSWRMTTLLRVINGYLKGRKTHEGNSEMKTSARLGLMYSLFKMSLANPSVALRNLSWGNLRRLFAAMPRHNSETVLHLVKERIEQGKVLVSIEQADETSHPGLRKAQALEKSYPGITHPMALGNIPLLEEKLAGPWCTLDPNAPARVNVLLPQLDPLIMFGGYIACLQFVHKIQQNGFRVRILLTESGDFDRDGVLAKLASNPALQQAVAVAEVENITQGAYPLVISSNDAFVGYSFWTCIKAHHLAQAIGKEFIFFLQEFEPIFHSHDSLYAIGSYVYRLPHKVIFNTELLADYFRSKRLGIFGQGDSADEQYVAFQHALTPTTPPSVEQLAQRKTRKLLFYGRPEGHARRNIFEIGILGLKAAIAQGVFEGDWEFYGVGTLGPDYDVDLGNGRVMKLSGTLPQSDYGVALGEFDIGLSLMLAPHPSILPFEMASAGQVVVTNTYESRTSEVLRGITPNIEPCEADPASIADALSIAVSRVDDSEGRIRGASFDWVRDWDHSFNDEVMEKISKFLRA